MTSRVEIMSERQSIESSPKDRQDIANRPPMGNWQQIETAPKDGTHVLGWDGRTMTAVSFFVPISKTFLGYWVLVECGAFAEDNEWTPTHWMPLPDPPRQTVE